MSIRRVLPVMLVLLCMSGCMKQPRRMAAVPEDMQSQTTVIGLKDVRYDAVNPGNLMTEYEAFRAHREAYYASQGHTGLLPAVQFLAISGGGDFGAFGAGLLCGWTKAGNRPQFDIVTGISTGALIAPFAFLGSAYDPQLKQVYTTISAKDIMHMRSKMAALYSDAVANTLPLHELLGKYINQQMVDAIGAEYNKGRLLLVATTNLDSRSPIVWNITKIAASGKPGRVELVQNVLIASASIPAVFPPVLIDVEAGGKRYQEMHVDGGTSAQVFAYPSALNVKPVEVAGQRQLYVIRNARLDADYAQVKRKTMDIATRALDSLITFQGIGDLYRIYLVAQRDKVDFNLAYIPSTFKAAHPAMFDTGYMNKLFDFAYQQAAAGYPWEKVPPGYYPSE